MYFETTILSAYSVSSVRVERKSLGAGVCCHSVDGEQSNVNYLVCHTNQVFCTVGFFAIRSRKNNGQFFQHVNCALKVWRALL